MIKNKRFCIDLDGDGKKDTATSYDSGYRLVGGYCSKSYNLLTGNYIVTNTNTIIDNPKLYKQTHKGNKKTKSIFAEDINDELLRQLDLAGNEFEEE